MHGPLKRMVAEKTHFEMPILNRIALSQVMEELEENEAMLIRLRYIDEQTQSQVAQALGMNQVAVSRLEKKILIKLRRKLA